MCHINLSEGFAEGASGGNLRKKNSSTLSISISKCEVEKEIKKFTSDLEKSSFNRASCLKLLSCLNLLGTSIRWMKKLAT